MKFFLNLLWASRKALADLSAKLNRIERQLETMAKTQEELDAQIDALTRAVKDAAERVSTDLQALKDKIAAMTSADFSAEFDKLQGSIDALKNIDAAASAPAQAPEGQ